MCAQTAKSVAFTHFSRRRLVPVKLAYNQRRPLKLTASEFNQFEPYASSPGIVRNTGWPEKVSHYQIFKKIVLNHINMTEMLNRLTRYVKLTKTLNCLLIQWIWTVIR